MTTRRVDEMGIGTYTTSYGRVLSSRGLEDGRVTLYFDSNHVGTWAPNFELVVEP